MGRKYAQVRSLAARVDMRTMRLCQWDIFEGLQSAGPRTSLLVAALFHEHVCQVLPMEGGGLGVDVAETQFRCPPFTTRPLSY